MTAISPTVRITPTTFTTAFAFVAQTNDFDDVFACVAMLSGIKIEEVRDIAIATTKHTARGAYFMGEVRIAALPAPVTARRDCVQGYWPRGRYPRRCLSDGRLQRRHGDWPARPVSSRKASRASGTTIEYALDPALWCKPADRVRTNFKNVAGTWAIGIHAMNTKGPRR
jgi:hypothetical protein